MNTESIVIVTASFNPEQMPAAQQYMLRAIAMLVNGGGEIVCRVKVKRAVIGDPKYQACLVMRFPSESAALAVFESKAYAEIVPLREAGFDAMDIAITSSM